MCVSVTYENMLAVRCREFLDPAHGGKGRLIITLHGHPGNNHHLCSFWTVLPLGLKQIWLSGRRIFFSGVNFPCWLPFWCRFHPQVTTVACRRSWTLCPKHRWQVRVKHTCTLCIWLCMKGHCKPWCLAACCTHNVRQGSSRFSSHVWTK